MGHFVNLWKIKESPHSVEYAYGPDIESSGLVELFKANGELRVVRTVLGISEQQNESLYLNLASNKLQQLRRQGDFPESIFLGH